MYKHKVTLVSEQGVKKEITFEDYKKAKKFMMISMDFATTFGGKVICETLKNNEL